MLARYHVRRLEDLPVYFIPVTIEAAEESDGRVMDQAYAAIERNEAQQNRLVPLSALLSPFLLGFRFKARAAACVERLSLAKRSASARKAAS